MTKLDRIRGSLIGGAAGDALGYAVEFESEQTIFGRYGEKGIQSYDLSAYNKAIISDDTQMTLFTANGLLVGETRSRRKGIAIAPRHPVSEAYQDWLKTQERSYKAGGEKKRSSWLLDVPELYDGRAPGITCLTALESQRRDKIETEDYIAMPVNNSKGCGGVMRVAPMGMVPADDIRALDWEGAQLAAITHGHSLGYIPAAVLVHIINRIVFPKQQQSLKDIVLEARDTVAEVFCGDPYLDTMTGLINLAVKLSENDEPDLDNIHRLGEGWVGEEALVIALYCSLRHADDFSAGLIAAVNHKGDSDSTGAIAGNILGAWVGYEAMEERWKQHLELSDVILEIADDLSRLSDTEGAEFPPKWNRKYVQMRRR